MSLYARGMTVREIQGHLAELYGAEVSPDLISRVTDARARRLRPGDLGAAPLPECYWSFVTNVAGIMDQPNRTGCACLSSPSIEI